MAESKNGDPEKLSTYRGLGSFLADSGSSRITNVSADGRAARSSCSVMPILTPRSIEGMGSGATRSAQSTYVAENIVIASAANHRRPNPLLGNVIALKRFMGRGSPGEAGC